MDKDLPVTVIDAASFKFNGMVKGRTLPGSQLIYCDGGAGELFAEDSLPMRFAAGDAIYLSPSALHGFLLDNASLRMLSFGGGYEMYIADFFDFNGVCVINNCLDCAAFFDAVEESKKSGADDLELSVLLYELIVNIGINNLDKSERMLRGNGYIIKLVTDCFIENFSKPGFSVDSLCKITGIPPKRLNEALRERLKMTAEEYFLFFRLENLRNLFFLRPHLGLERCALTNGFTNYREFEHAFTSAYGITPKDFTEGVRRSILPRELYAITASPAV